MTHQIIDLKHDETYAVSGGLAFLAVALTPQVIGAGLAVFSAGAAAGYKIVSDILD